MQEKLTFNGKVKTIIRDTFIFLNDKFSSVRFKTYSVILFVALQVVFFDR